MKNIFLTLTIAFSLSTLASNAGNHSNMLKIYDISGKTFCITMKADTANDSFEFDTKVVFHHLKSATPNERVDIRPFVKPEKEVDESHPFTTDSAN